MREGNRMEAELIIKTALSVIGTGLIVGGIVALVRSSSTKSKILAAVAVAAGIVIWLIILFTTIVSSTIV
jgi:hypothetical protein